MLRSARALPLALLGLAACATATATPTSTETGPGRDRSRNASSAAFVVVSEADTWVVPVDPGAPVMHAEGLWLLDETDGAVVRPAPSPASRGRAVCVASGSPSECTGDARVRLEDSLEATLDPACACFRGPDTDRCDDDPFRYLGIDAWSDTTGVTFDDLLAFRRSADGDDSDDDDDDDDDGGNDYLEEDDEDCEEYGARIVSLHAGTLYSETFEHNGCGGMNLYGSSSETVELTGDARVFRVRDADEISCDPEGAFLDGWAVRSEEEELLYRNGRWYVPEDARDDDYGLERCGAYSTPDGEVVFHEGSHLLVVGADVDVTGGGARFSARLRADESTCTPADPCGSPAGFAAFEGLDPGDLMLVHLFVATDGSAALAWGEHRLDVFRREDDVPSRTSPFAGELVGVRFHADARRLVRAMELEARHEATTSTGGAECGAGLEAVDGACRARCSEDLDCRGVLGCESVCRAGLCDDEGVECTATHPCGVDAVCRDARCVDVELAADDSTFEDTRAGSGWGDRCIAHLRRGELDAAQAACAAGLEAATRDATRGALLYNLGLVAERRGDRVSARLDYEASLRVRSNATVARALAAVGGPFEP